MSSRSFVSIRGPFLRLFGVEMRFLERWDEANFLELGKKAEEHFFGVDPFEETVSAGFGGIGHDVVLDIEDGFAEGPGDGLFERIIE